MKGYFFDAGKCTKCHDTCAECSAAGPSGCTTCPPLRSNANAPSAGPCHCKGNLEDVEGVCISTDDCCAG
jgi:hypothetical protein